MVFLPVNNILLALSAPLAGQGVAVNHEARALQPLGDGVPLRIMPLGASITFGQGSTLNTGYRLDLRNLLTAAGNPVNMVGSRRGGKMTDNDNEGWHGYRIDQVHEQAASLPYSSSSSNNTNITSSDPDSDPDSNLPSPVSLYRPNIVLLNAGTNDALQTYNIAHAGARMEALIRDIWLLSPRAVVLLSTLVLNTRPEVERNVLVINHQFRELAGKLGREGRKVLLAEMHGDDGPDRDDMRDDTHPNDEGYRKMARVWLRGLVEASKRGWLQRPETVKGLPDDGGR